jgi:hypothetical protein
MSSLSGASQNNESRKIGGADSMIVASDVNDSKMALFRMPNEFSNIFI